MIYSPEIANPTSAVASALTYRITLFDDAPDLVWDFHSLMPAITILAFLECVLISLDVCMNHNIFQSLAIPESMLANGFIFSRNNGNLFFR